MVLVDLTKAEIRRIMTDLHTPFIYEIEELKKPQALQWKRLTEKLERALNQKTLLGGGWVRKQGPGTAGFWEPLELGPCDRLFRQRRAARERFRHGLVASHALP